MPIFARFKLRKSALGSFDNIYLLARPKLAKGRRVANLLRMARKSSTDSTPHHGFNDVIGIVLVGFALLLLVALFSYQKSDVSANMLPPNTSARNWIGPFGAWTAYFIFFGFGAAAYELPALLFLLGLGCFFHFFSSL